MLRVQLYDLPKVGDGQFGFTLAGVGQAADKVGVHAFGVQLHAAAIALPVQFNGAAIVGDGLFDLAQVGIGQPPVQVSLRVLRVQFDA